MISVGSEVQVLPDPPNCLKPFERPKLKNTGGIAQLVEHLLCKQGVIGSIPFASTKSKSDLKKNHQNDDKLKNSNKTKNPLQIKADWV